MKKAMTIGFALVGGMLLGRALTDASPEAKFAIEARDRADKIASEATADAKWARTRLAVAERRFVELWRRIDGVLEDYAAATTVMGREHARHRLDALRWDLQADEARLAVARRPVRITGWELVQPDVAK